MDLYELVAEEAHAANRAASVLTDDAVSDGLATAGRLVHEQRGAILAANRADVDAALAVFDAGVVDRIGLDDARIDALGRQIAATAALEPLMRDGGSWTRPNGLRVTERRIPIGTVGANFEARPSVALDIAGQLLKSLNAGVLRTGSAALRTVTVLVDEVLRPALERAGLPPAVIGLVRSADREGARALVSLPEYIPLVILRGSGETTAQLARLAAEHGVRTLAHAEGGGVLYVHHTADREKAEALIEASLDRLGVCNRLNVLLVDDAEQVPHALLKQLGIAVREPERLGHEWASDPDHIASLTVRVVQSEYEAAVLANEQTSGLAATIVTEDEEVAERFLSSYRGTAAFWNTTTRFTDGFALTGSPETGINVDRFPGPRGPVTYRDLWLRQYRIVGDGSQRR